MKFGRSFFSLYFLVISTFILFSWLLDNGWNSYIEQDIESYTGYKTMLLAIGDYIQKHPEDEWEILVEQTAKRYKLPLKLVPVSEVDAKQLGSYRALQKGNTHVYYDDDNVVLHQLLEGTETLLTLGPAQMPTRPRAEAFFRVLILATTGFIIFIWLWPMSKDLDELKKVTRSFGQGDFDVKAPVAKSNMIEPMMLSFNMMADRIKRLIDAHKELSNAVSHELRTPLARTKFALQMLSSIKEDDKRKKYLKQICNDVLELEELINEMLIYASFDSDKPALTFSEGNILTLVENQVASHQQFQGNISIIDHAPGLSPVFDERFIDRALNNFISNAIKYGKDNVRITISEDDGDCVICVEDNGDGVSNEFKEIIFDAFSRGDQSRNRETGGFGLGLAIVARIMEWHQGKASIADSDLGGANFMLRWPIN